MWIIGILVFIVVCLLAIGIVSNMNDEEYYDAGEAPDVPGALTDQGSKDLPVYTYAQWCKDECGVDLGDYDGYVQ